MEIHPWHLRWVEIEHHFLKKLTTYFNQWFDHLPHRRPVQPDLQGPLATRVVLVYTQLHDGYTTPPNLFRDVTLHYKSKILYILVLQSLLIFDTTKIRERERHLRHVVSKNGLLSEESNNRVGDSVREVWGNIFGICCWEYGSFWILGIWYKIRKVGEKNL